MRILDPAVARRRGISVAVTLSVAAPLLHFALSAPPGSTSFYVFSLVVAALWLIGSLATPDSGDARRSRPDGQRFVAPVAVAILLFVAFVVADLIARHVPVLAHALGDILDKADKGPLILVVLLAAVSGTAEELFFRGALYAAIESWARDQRYAAVGSVVVYAAVTTLTGNLALVAAAVVLGTVTALERRSTGGVFAPAVTHVVWSTLMILALPR